MGKTVKIYMCCHKEYGYVPPLTVPIQCGSELYAKIIGALPDVGKNGDISEKNRWYCELTAHYYAWKNVVADYYGFCHYRRFFAVSDSTAKPYIVCGRLTPKYMRILYKEDDIDKMAEEGYDVIVPRCENMGITVADHYSLSSGHLEKDLKCFIEILSERAPYLSECAGEYLKQNDQYFCNMFIMEKKRFNEYCGILFPVLEEFDRRGSHAYRTDGYLGEVFTGIYITYLKKNGVKIKETVRLDIGCGFKKRFLYKIFPPESRRRFIAKKIVKSLSRIKKQKG